MPECIFMENNDGKTFLDCITDEQVKADCFKIAKKGLSEKLEFEK